MNSALSTKKTSFGKWPIPINVVQQININEKLLRGLICVPIKKSCHNNDVIAPLSNSEK